MYKKINNQADFENIVSLSEAKTQCRVMHTMDDTYLETLILVACELAQVYTARMITQGSATVVVERCESVITMPFGEVTTITELLLDGTTSTDFTFEPVTQKLTINTAYSVAKATFNAGYIEPPKAVKQAILMLVSTMYDTRQDHIAGLTVAQMPLTSKMLLDTVKIYGI